MKVFVTGSDGFVAKNLILRLKERKDIHLVLFNKKNKTSDLLNLLENIDFIFHFAGVNRSQNEEDFQNTNVGLTHDLIEAVKKTGCAAPIIYTSSIQAELENPYGISKKNAENKLKELNNSKKIQSSIFRLENVFGKWAKPNYNSAVATFCNNIAKDLPIEINDPESLINLIYIDDVVEKFIRLIDSVDVLKEYDQVHPKYQISVGDLASLLYKFKESRDSLITEDVGTGLQRALYSTYLSYLPAKLFSYQVKQHTDDRGTFVEMLKTYNSGQFSFFTAHPGITRGGHYHNTKTEKFLVLKGSAKFKFKNMLDGEYYEIVVNEKDSKIVETIPGWAHDITNIGNSELVVMLWANEIFDHEKADTYNASLEYELK